jgi:hypothetical protein
MSHGAAASHARRVGRARVSVAAPRRVERA